MTVAPPLRVALLFGGPSAEHEISLRSARAVAHHLDDKSYEAVLCGITQEGGWLSQEASARLLAGENPGEEGTCPILPDVDCVFPVLHGPYGEDGKVQGWLQMLNVPFVGSAAKGSVLGMDKSLTKHMLRTEGVLVASWTDVFYRDFEENPEGVAKRVGEERGFPCFVKPVSQGSSVGISRAADEAELRTALELALKYGRYAMVEPEIKGRELEVAVLGGEDPVVTVPGEVRPEEWYTYEAKYEDDTADLLVPALGIHPNLVKGIQDIALNVFRILHLRGLARVDFFLEKSTGRVYVNEVNTMPGFTDISMYPQLMEHTGIPFPELLHRLINHAINEDHECS
jgi:D-alanine-D-alanine ligase